MKQHANKSLLLVLLLAVVWTNVQAQYFGRNKPRYENFDFEVVHSPHFEIYHYLQDSSKVYDLANWSEHWYHNHQEALKDTFLHKNPVIFYNNHADFQQTNSISGRVGIGTGGVTEGLKNRVVMPIAMSNQQTNHVLGHEMVHAFQYHMIINSDSTSLKNMANIPLWMVEGLAEYMSIGRQDAHTSMWMRDAVLNKDVPSIKDLNSGRYFPYRYGQAFWAFLTGLKGDEIIEPFFIATAKEGLASACQSVLNMSLENLSNLWETGIKHHYGQFVDTTATAKERLVGKPLITEENGGKMNISPVLSPNGRYVIFLSEKNLFSTDLFLADARTGKILRNVASQTRDGHIDDFNFIESAGTWSPNSKEFAFVAVAQGHNVMIVKDAFSGKTIEEFSIEGVPAFSNPAWSPDGKNIVVAGLVDGQVDLYQVDLKSKKVTQLTNDIYSEMQPNWSADGSQLVYASDRLSLEKGKHSNDWSFNLTLMNRTDGTVRDLDFFATADNLNPVFDNQGNILFLSNRDGFRNMYKYDLTTDKIYQLTDLMTGVSGITHHAPAITATRSDKRDRILYMHYTKGAYNIHQAKPEDFLNQEVDPTAVDMAAATLPRINDRAPNIVDKNLDNMEELENISSDSLVGVAYKPKFKLDYAGGSAGVGVGRSNVVGTSTGLAGGVDLLFGDILGNNQIFTSIAMNGEIYDFGGQVTYLNQDKRIGWGATLSHVPYRTGGSFGYAGIDTVEFSNGAQTLADHYIFESQRIFEDKVGAFAQYPFSTTLRAEIGTSLSRFSYRVDRFDNYYDALGRLISQDRTKQDAPDAFNLGNINAAIVGDNSYFGLTSPLSGHRYRFGVEKYFGAFDFFSATADYRKYIYLKPVSFAVRAMHYGRYGKDANRISPMYLGSPWYVRGYDFDNASELLLQNGKSVNQLFGSKLAVGNVEVRIPFTGPERLSLIKSKLFFTELAFFLDGGIAFSEFSDFGNGVENGTNTLTPSPVFSTGASLRINLFGALILEPYYAFPLQKSTRGTFGLNIIPGW